MNNGHYVIATSCLYNLHWLCICICGSFLLLIAVEVVATPLASLLSTFLSVSIALDIIGGLFKTSMKACVQARIRVFSPVATTRKVLDTYLTTVL